MKVLILAGGFARRMGSIGENTPKALLPVVGRPVIEHILDKVGPLGLTDVFISTNKRFERSFSDWAGSFDTGLNLHHVIEPAMEEGQKLGSVGALHYFLENRRIDEDLLVINGDNLFRFDLKKFLEFYNDRKSFSFGVYDAKSHDEARKMGVVLLDKDGLVVDFEEKPENPKSTTVSTGIYIIPKKSIHLVRDYIAAGNPADRMGDFLAWMMKRQKIHAFVFREKWFDIGTPDTYKMADEEFRKGV